MGMLILAYALWTYELRSKFMHKKQVGGGGARAAAAAAVTGSSSASCVQASTCCLLAKPQQPWPMLWPWQQQAAARAHAARPTCAQVGMFDDRIGPTVIACMVLATLVVVFALALYDYMF